jgi:hypothetical protein
MKYVLRQGVRHTVIQDLHIEIYVRGACFKYGTLRTVFVRELSDDHLS